MVVIPIFIGLAVAAALISITDYESEKSIREWRKYKWLKL